MPGEPGITTHLSSTSQPSQARAYRKENTVLHRSKTKAPSPGLLPLGALAAGFGLLHLGAMAQTAPAKPETTLQPISVKEKAETDANSVS